MTRYAIIDADNVVSNIIVWDGVDPWEAPEGTQVRALTDGESASIGWHFDGKSFSDPNPPPPIVAPVELTAEQKLAAAGLTVADLKKLLGLA